MTIYKSTKKLDLSSPRVVAALYHEWITECWIELPFTQNTPSQRLEIIFTRRRLPNLAGLYSISAKLYCHHLSLQIINRSGRLLTISERLPSWIAEQDCTEGFEHMLYIGETDNLFDRWSGHNKMASFRKFVECGIELKFRFCTEPPFIDKKYSSRHWVEDLLIDHLRPLLNFH